MLKRGNHNPILAMAVLLLTHDMNVHLLLLFLQESHIYQFHNQTGQHSNDHLTAKNFRNRHYRHRLRNQNRKHLIRSGQIDSDQSSDRNDSSGKKARCRCRKPALRNHTEQTAPHRSPFSGGLYLPAQLASRMMFQCLHKKISQK